MLDRRTLLTAAAAVPLAACAIGRVSSNARGLRVVTFNIWHDAGDWAARQPLLIEALREVDADVIALQEVLEDATKSLPNQAETLAARWAAIQFTFSRPTRQALRVAMAMPSSPACRCSPRRQGKLSR